MMKEFSRAGDLLSKAQKTVTVSMRESDVLHAWTKCNIWSKNKGAGEGGRLIGIVY